jgi:hypothetical protein
MTVRLVKQGQKIDETRKETVQPSANQLLVITQGWVQEFKARKAKGNGGIALLAKQS